MFKVSGELGQKVYNAFSFFFFFLIHMFYGKLVYGFLYQAISKYKRKLISVAVRSLKM